MYLQALKCMLLFNFTLPANVQLVMEELKKFIGFESLKINNLLLLFVTEAEMKEMEESFQTRMANIKEARA